MQWLHMTSVWCHKQIFHFQIKIHVYKANSNKCTVLSKQNQTLDQENGFERTLKKGY